MLNREAISNPVRASSPSLGLASAKAAVTCRKAAQPFTERARFSFICITRDRVYHPSVYSLPRLANTERLGLATS